MSSKAETMKKKGKCAWTPKLRFPEFRDAPAWEEKPLVEVCDRITQGGTPDTSNPKYWNGVIDWLTPAEMGKSESPFIDSTRRKITELGLESCSSELLPVRSVIISTRAPIGYLAINTVPMAINQGCRGLITGVRFNYAFLFYSLVSAKPRIIDLGAGNTFKELSGTSLKIFSIPVPSPPEQQKIADCLSSLGGLIAAEGRMLEALKAHKKGLMQQLFPQPGQTQPRLRFPEFWEGGGWKEKSLGEVARLKNGYAFKSSTYVESGPYRIVTIANVQSGWLSLESTKYLPALPEDIQKHQKLRIGDVLISMTGNVGRVCRVTEENLLLNQRVGKIIPKGVNEDFLYQSLLREEFRNVMQLNAAGGAQGNLSSSTITSFGLSLPSDQTEQQKIADCLAAIDDGIAAQADKIETLKQHKRGLMQQLFPAPEEQ